MPGAGFELSPPGSRLLCLRRQSVLLAACGRPGSAIGMLSFREGRWGKTLGAGWPLAVGAR